MRLDIRTDTGLSCKDLAQQPWLQAVFACLLVTEIMVLRRPDAFLNPQFWAEDGLVFFMGNEMGGIHALTQDYAGYLHLIPRLIAFCGTPFSPDYSPAFFNYAAFGCELCVIARLFSPRLQLPGKLWLALSFALVPHTGEVFVNLTNVQWYTVFLLIQTLLMREARTWREQASDLGITVLAGLTGPFCLLMLPFFAWKYWVQRTRSNLGLLGVLAICACVQAWLILSFRIPPNGTPFAVVRMVAMMAGRVVLLLFLGEKNQLPLSAGTTVWLASFLLGGLVYVSLSSAELRREKLLLWLCIVVMLAAANARGRLDTWSFDDFINGDRYLFVPKVLLLWLLVLEFSVPRHRRIAWGLALLVVASNWPGFRAAPYQDLHWHDYCGKIREGRAVAVPINPSGWVMAYPKRKH